VARASPRSRGRRRLGIQERDFRIREAATAMFVIANMMMGHIIEMTEF
jgi:hypothetical protein